MAIDRDFFQLPHQHAFSDDIECSRAAGAASPAGLATCGLLLEHPAVDNLIVSSDFLEEDMVDFDGVDAFLSQGVFH